MTPEGRFLVVALMIIALFAVRLMFGNATAAGIVDEWQAGNRNRMAGAIRRFFLNCGITVQPGLVVVALLLLSGAVFFFFIELTPGSWLAPPMAALIFLLAVLGLMRDFSSWQARRFEAGLIDAVDIMASALSVGENTVKALETAANSTSGRVSKELREIVHRLDLGAEIDQACQRLVDVYDSEGVRLFTQSLRAKWQVGGDLALLLISVNRIIRERSKLRMQLSGQLAGVRYAALFLAFAPYVLYMFFLWTQPGWVAVIHDHPRGGQWIYIALGLQAAGLLWLLSILKSES